MHELALCQALLDQLAAIAARHRADSITSIIVQVGPLSGVEAGLFARAFEIAREGTLASRAALTIRTGAIVTECTACGATSKVTKNRLRCVGCGNFRVTIVEGRELLLESVELNIAEKLHVY